MLFQADRAGPPGSSEILASRSIRELFGQELEPISHKFGCR